MATCSICLGTQDRVGQLYSYPNAPADTESLADTVRHWFNLTLQRDGLAEQGATSAARIDGANYVLDLDGPPTIAAKLAEYGVRLPKFLDNGWQALTTVVPQLKATGKWDPSPDPEPPPYRPWRFFLPLGMAMLNQRSLQFFHYPPIRLLETFQDYLNDPVPTRWEELLAANGVPQKDLPLFNTVLDATPIAAEDDQGSKPGGDPEWGLIPIQYFHAYQQAMVLLLLNNAPQSAGYTVPIVVYGAHPRATFQQLYNVQLGINVAATAEIVPGRKTAVLGSNHPYVFYATAQGFPTVGSGQFLSLQACQAAASVMQSDLVVARWQKIMSDDPSQDPQAVLKDCTSYWSDPKRAPEICALTKHQGSLFYSNPVTLQYTFKLTLAQGAAFCKANANNPCAGLSVSPST
jgi:hypothetical protein